MYKRMSWSLEGNGQAMGDIAGLFQDVFVERKKSDIINFKT